MDFPELNSETLAASEQVLGYLNFSSGASDPQVLRGLDLIYGAVIQAQRRERSASGGPRGRRRRGAKGSSPAGNPPANVPPHWQQVMGLLERQLGQLHESSPAFANIEQSAAVLELVREHVLPGYRVFHRDMLFHQPDDHLFNSFMLGRVFEVVLSQPQPWDDPARVADRTISGLNVFLGHRPVPTLESQKIEPRPREWVRPIPVYVAGAGVAEGPYQALIETALQLLAGLDEDLRAASYFDPAALDELAIDPRAYDFEHPVNKRPNYHFGEWDPHCIDNQGRYRRFVVREVTLRALMARVDPLPRGGPPRRELLWEAAAVLAGTIMMASGVSGSGPGTHDSQATLMTLITRIAAYRDAFYERLLDQLSGSHGTRLRQEARRLRQPLGGARQHLNTHLSRQRAAQLEHVKLAMVFARMGYVEAARRQADAVKVAAARMLCRIDCSLTAGRQAIRRHDHQGALEQLDRIVDLLHRGIDCGAIVDPWNILGFDANFSLFPALENSIRDHRLDDLIAMMDRVFDLFARLWSDAAAMDDQQMAGRVESRYEEIANWWHRFAAHEVSSVDGNSALLELEAARQVAVALNSWHRGGAATGDVRFWAPYVENFDSPKAYSLVIDTLLGKRDFVSSMSLLVHWLSQTPGVALEAGQSSYHRSAIRWVQSVVRLGFQQRASVEGQGAEDPDRLTATRAWKLLRRFFACLEPNAEEYWEPPEFRLALPGRPLSEGESPADLEEEDSSEALFGAAYEDVVYRDSTDDGFDGSLFESGTQTNDELQRESERIADRLAFVEGLALMWATTSIAVGTAGEAAIPQAERDTAVTALTEWYRRATQNRRQLLRLLDQIGAESIPPPAGHHESMIDYDRHRLLKETLIEQIIATIVETSQAERFLLAAIEVLTGGQPDAEPEPSRAKTAKDSNAPAEQEATQELRRAAQLLAAALRGDREAAASICDELLEDLPGREILYVPLSKSGTPREIATVRIRQRTIENLLVALPRLGLVAHTQRLIDTARDMEKNVPVGRGAVTQFDELFEVGFRELVGCLVRTATPEAGTGEQAARADATLIAFLEQLTESILRSWLDHSRTLRLSVLERVRGDQSWKNLVSFIKRYGSDLFTQRFLGLGNIRAILHCGVDSWLTQLEESGLEPPFRLLEELDRTIPRPKAIEYLTLILEAIVENYHEYRDYNSTTTQSDQGEMLYMLLDFLRLQSAYDRVAWHLKPVVTSHEILVRSGRNEAAQLWRRALSERVGEEAEEYLKRLAKLQAKYAMRMASVADRLGERFMRPMTIDRMRALVQPAIRQLDQPGHQHAFEILEEETALLMREPAGSGLDVPLWLVALEEEIERLKPWSPEDQDAADDELFIQPCRLEPEELQRQLDEL